MIHLGVDASKAELVAMDEERLQKVPNQKRKIQAFLASFPNPGSLAVESTGGYETELAKAAHEAGWIVYVLQPAWVKAFARMQGSRAKTDAVDARLIRDFLIARKDSLRPWTPPEERIEKLQSIFRQRQRLADDIARMRTRYRALGMEKTMLKALLAGPLNARKVLDTQLEQLLKDDPIAQRLLAVPGVGPQTTAAVVCTLGKGTFLKAESFVAFAGLDPSAYESGQSKGQRRISKKGDQSLRRALFMAAMNGSKLPTWKPRIQAMKERGMAPTKAIVALARKIATVLFHIANNNVQFDPTKVQLKTKEA